MEIKTKTKTLCGPHTFFNMKLLSWALTIYIKYIYGHVSLYIDGETFLPQPLFWICVELMDRSEGKRVLRHKEEEEDDDDEEEDEEEEEPEMGFGKDGRRNKRVMRDLHGKRGSKGGGSMLPSCQVDNCDADLSEAKQYHRRHKVCEYHAKAPSVHMAGLQQRFCQQCSRFHELSEFDGSKRSCRTRLAGHNERRRKNAVDYNGE